MNRPIVFRGREATLLEVALFTMLLGGPRGPRTLAGRLGLHPERSVELFEALVAAGLLERHGDRYRNIEEVERLLAPAGRRRPSLVGLLPLTLVLLLGALAFGGWGRFAPRLRTIAVQAGVMTEESGPLPVAASPGSDPRFHVPFHLSPQPTGEADAISVFVLVGSRGQAEEVVADPRRAGLKPAAWQYTITDARAAAAWAPIAPAEVGTIVVTRSGAEADLLRRQVANANAVRASEGTPPVEILDWR